MRAAQYIHQAVFKEKLRNFLLITFYLSLDPLDIRFQIVDCMEL